MHLEFHDVYGETGIVREDYSVDYTGTVEEEVKEIVTTVPESRFDTTHPPPKPVLQRLLLDIYAVPSIIAVELAGDELKSSSQDRRLEHRSFWL
jgi:hypothetical protein